MSEEPHKKSHSLTVHSLEKLTSSPVPENFLAYKIEINSLQTSIVFNQMHQTFYLVQVCLSYIVFSFIHVSVVRFLKL
jgi:hypothetical protein